MPLGALRPAPIASRRAPDELHRLIDILVVSWIAEEGVQTLEVRSNLLNMLEKSKPAEEAGLVLSCGLTGCHWARFSSGQELLEHPRLGTGRVASKRVYQQGTGVKNRFGLQERPRLAEGRVKLREAMGAPDQVAVSRTGRPSRYSATSSVGITSAYLQFRSKRLTAWLASKRSKAVSSGITTLKLNE